MMMKSQDIRNLTLREGRSLKVFDFFLSNRNRNQKLKFEAARWILSRLYPETVEHTGDIGVSLTGLITAAHGINGINQTTSNRLDEQSAN